MNSDIDETRVYVRLKYQLGNGRSVREIFDTLPDPVIDYIGDNVKWKNDVDFIRIPRIYFFIFVPVMAELEELLVKYHLQLKK